MRGIKQKEFTVWRSTFILGNGAFYNYDSHPCGTIIEKIKFKISNKLRAIASKR